MAVGPRNKSELKAVVRDFIADETFDDKVLDTLIALTDAELRRELRILPMEKSQAFTLTSDRLVVPARFLSVKLLYLEVHGRKRPLRPSTLDQLVDEYGCRDLAPPVVYALEGVEDQLPVLVFGPTPDASYTGRLVFMANPALLDDADFNDILLDQPDLYVYGTLTHAEAYIKNAERTAVWGALYGRALESAKASDTRDRVSGGVLTPTARYRDGL